MCSIQVAFLRVARTMHHESPDRESVDRAKQVQVAEGPATEQGRKAFLHVGHPSDRSGDRSHQCADLQMGVCASAVTFALNGIRLEAKARQRRCLSPGKGKKSIIPLLVLILIEYGMPAAPYNPTE